MLRTRKTCRACGSSALQPVLSLGEQELASNFAISADFPPTDRTIPLEVVRCSPDLDENACGLVQLRHTVPGDLMYSSYGYRSGINQTMTQHLAGIARGLEERLELKADDLVVDIGANDGTLLLAYHGRGLKLIQATITSALGNNPDPVFDGDRDSRRKVVNAFIRSAGIFDSVADFDRVTVDPSTGQMRAEFLHNSTTNVVDHLHPNRAGYLKMGGEVDILVLAPPSEKRSERH